MGLNETPRANRLHIGIYGRRNAGKSSLINALTGQELAIVSPAPGTTADPVFKSMELHPVGPVVFIDTAGFDDEGELGLLRVAKTEEVIAMTDIAVLVIDGVELAGRIAAGGAATGADALAEELQWLRKLEKANVPVILTVNKWEQMKDRGRQAVTEAVIELGTSDRPLAVSAVNGAGVEALRQAIAKAVPEELMRERIIGDLASDGGLVLLVMPQDIQAPKGRLILPQVQTIRELLDKRCTVVSTTSGGLDRALAVLREPPELIVTDSQCFGEVYQKKPAESGLTSFSILMAACKGDIEVFAEGASAIDEALRQNAPGTAPFRVLIAEACTHVPLTEDIGTVKIPRLLKKAFGDRVEITGVRGNDFPGEAELKQFDLIIHCGACMFNRRHVMNRIAAARQAGVPITNYGIFLAKMNGILDKVRLP